MRKNLRQLGQTDDERDLFLFLFFFASCGHTTFPTDFPLGDVYVENAIFHQLGPFVISFLG